MLLSLLPTAVFAAGGTWVEVELADIQATDIIAITVHGSATDKDYVMKNDGGTNIYGPADTWDSSNTGNETWYWNVVSKEDGYQIYPAGTTESWLYCVDHNNGLRVGNNNETLWTLDAESGYLSCVDTAGNVRYMGIYDNNGGDTSVNPNFRTYKNTTGNTKDQTTTFYRLDGAGGGDPEPDPGEEPEVISISDALAAGNGTENLTVKGVVTLIDGKNVYLQDGTGGICVRMSGNFDDIALGDTVIGTGKRDTYNGLPQLGSATYEKSSGLTLTPTVKTIGELTTADICTYVTIQNVEVTKVFDDNGQYENPNITVEDADGNTIQIYKAVVDKNEDGTWPVAVGSVITITAAVSVYNGTLQLRNTTAAEIDLDGTPAGPIAHGDQVVIYNPAYNKALSSTYTGYYNNGTAVTMTDDGLTGFGETDVWTVADNGDGTWSFSYGGQNIGMGDKYSSMPLGEKNDKWTLEDAGDGLYYIKNTVRNSYMEWYDSKGNWSGFEYINEGTESLFALAFYEVTGIPEPPSGEVEFPKDPFVIYNVSTGQYGHEGVLGGQDDNETSPSILDVSATLSDGKAVPANGARVFTVEKNGEYYRFKTNDGYLCSNGTGSNAFYSLTPSEDADWKITAGKKGGWNLESRTAKFQGKYAQYLEYFGGSYKSYSMYNVTDYDIYEFFFYPLAEDVRVTEGVVNMPTVTFGTLPDAYVGQDYTVTFTVDAVFGVNAVSAEYGDNDAELTNDNGTYSFTIPASALSEGKLTVTVSGTDTKGVTFEDGAEITVVDEPVITGVSPAASAQTGEDKRPEISVTFTNAEENPTVTMTVNGQEVAPTVTDGKAAYIPDTDLPNGKVTVTATVTRGDGKSATKTWSFTIGTAQYQLYFGQLHSHTTYSDGSGSLKSALEYVQNLPDNANVDFVAFTDHSNYFDKSGEANPAAALYDTTQMTAYSQNLWKEYKGTIANFNASQSDVVALAGFEMTWSGGPGHINTFNTEGIVSRNNAALNNKTADAGMKAYYSLLSQTEGADSISQFNHPGDTFGTFIDFAYWDPVIDTRIQLVEVGNGEGAIGAGGYYPSYEYYVMALDKGWHVAPTNNQDNHKGKWGNANDARDVILTDDFSEEGIYQAIRDRRIYATEDKNLEITYTLNGELLGSTIADAESANIKVSVYDPDASDSISKVEVVVNSGAVAYTWDDPEELASGALSCTIPADYSYYFIRVTQDVRHRQSGHR